MRNVKKTLFVLAFAAIALLQQKAVAKPPACSSTYNPPASVEERKNSGWFDGRVAKTAFKNTTDGTLIVTLYHPDNRASFRYWVVAPGENFYLGSFNYGSDWGIQVNEGDICLIGRVSTFNDGSFNVTSGLMGLSGFSLDDLRERANGFQERDQGRALARQGRRMAAIRQLAYAADVFRVQKKAGEERATRNEIKSLMK